jgi:membrane associated rhomboid family serine protease
MSIFSSYQWGTSKTPAVIRNLIIITCLTSIFVALTNHLFVYILGISGPQQLLTLSSYGMQHYYLWQPITYLFTQTATNGIDVFYLMSLAFNMYILWAFGSAVEERIGSKHFLALYLGCGALAGIIAWALMPILGQYAVFSGPATALLAVFIMWSMLFPNSELIFFPIIPIKTKWLTAAVLGIICLTTLSQLNFITFVLYFAAALCAYLYGIIAFNLHTPFAKTHHVDAWLAQFFSRFRVGAIKKSDTKSTTKIYDIKSGDPVLSDDAFVDEMLSKISKGGEKSLTMRERRRMRQISERKMKENSKRDTET